MSLLKISLCWTALSYPPRPLRLVELYQRANVLATGSWLPSNAAAAPRLDAIQVFSAGVNHISQHPIFTDSEIRIASANGVHGPQIAEWVIMMNLIFSHGYPPLYEAQRRCEWARQQAVQPRDSVGQRVGVLGYGSIGRQGQLTLVHFLPWIGVPGHGRRELTCAIIPLLSRLFHAMHRFRRGTQTLCHLAFGILAPHEASKANCITPAPHSGTRLQFYGHGRDRLYCLATTDARVAKR